MDSSKDLSQLEAKAERIAKAILERTPVPGESKQQQQIKTAKALRPESPWVKVPLQGKVKDIAIDLIHQGRGREIIERVKDIDAAESWWLVTGEDCTFFLLPKGNKSRSLPRQLQTAIRTFHSVQGSKFGAEGTYKPGPDVIDPGPSGHH